jgi:peptidoglycan hydrolase CwlO-like protein
MPNLVKHPETGQPAFELISYQAAELTQLENDVADKQNQVNDRTNELAVIQSQLESKQAEVAECQAALEDSKSYIGTFHEIAEQPQTDDATEGTSSEGEDQPTDGVVQVPVQF